MVRRPLEKIIARIATPELVDILARRLSGSELHTLLLEVADCRAAEKTPTELLRQYARDRFVRPSTADPQLLLEFDRLAFSLLTPEFEAFELSPVCPLGTNAAIATCSQKKVVSTMRDSEVMADPTTLLALELALRRRTSGDRHTTLRFCASHRLTRAQAFANPAMTAHFRLLALVTGGRDRGSWHFETDSLTEHISFYLKLFANAPTIGLAFAEPLVALTPLSPAIPSDLVEQRVLAPLRVAYPEARFAIDPDRQQGSNYYRTLCFRIEATTPEGLTLMLTDGGFTDWTRKLTSNAKERLMTSGIGTELACKLFRVQQED